jgi:hypothetical protein
MLDVGLGSPERVVVAAGVGGGGLGEGDEAEGIFDGHPENNRAAARGRRIRIAENSRSRQRKNNSFRLVSGFDFAPAMQEQ